jgi:hypothetical protein
MPSRDKEYRRRAQEADQSALVSTDPLARETFENVAEQWRALATLVSRKALWELP